MFIVKKSPFQKETAAETGQLYYLPERASTEADHTVTLSQSAMHADRTLVWQNDVNIEILF